MQPMQYPPMPGYANPYGQPAAPQGYPQQPYPTPQVPAAPPMPTGPAPAADSLFGGGNSFKFDMPGHEVTLDITGVDVRPQTEKNTSRIKTWQDGSTMYMVIVTGTVISSNNAMFPAGSVSSITLSGGRFSAAKIAFNAVKVKGPSIGGRLRMKFTQLSDRPPARPGDSPAKRYEAQYWPPAPVEVPIMASDQRAAQAPVPQSAEGMSVHASVSPYPQVAPPAAPVSPVQAQAQSYIGSPDPGAQYPPHPVSAPVAPPAAAPVMSAPPAPVAPQAPVQPTAQPGIDPSLWAMLTPEQQAQYLNGQPTPF